MRVHVRVHKKAKFGADKRINRIAKNIFKRGAKKGSDKNACIRSKKRVSGVIKKSKKGVSIGVKKRVSRRVNKIKT